MCGLVGMAGNISRHDIETTFRDMLDVSQIRGRDSTGVIRVLPNNRGYDWAKEIGTPNFLVDTRRYEQRILGQAAAVIGHTRAKTVGEAVRKNAHPFDFPEQGICGVHNGTLRNYYKLVGYEAGMVDSEALYAHLSRSNPQDTFSEVDGAFACVWWNDQEKTLNFIRNEERTLYFAYSEDKKTVYWASEMWMFGAVSRKKKLFVDEKTGQAIYPLEPHMLYTLRINTAAINKDPVLVWRPLERINPKPKTAHVWHHGYHGLKENDKDTKWIDQGDGSYLRVIGGNNKTDAGQGGPVSNPFQRATQPEAAKTNQKESQASLPALIAASPAVTNSPSTSSKEEDGSLNDDLPNFLKSKTPWKHRKKLSVAVKESSSQNSTNPSTKTLTLPLSGGSSSKTSSVSRTPANGEPSPPSSVVVPLFGSKGQTTSFSSCVSPEKTQRPAVSFRMVAGLFFVTDNVSCNEYEASQLLKRAGYACAFCQVPLNLHTDIGTILNDKACLCRECTNETSNTAQIINARHNHRFKHV